jgi:hypothetical protein
MSNTLATFFIADKDKKLSFYFWATKRAGITADFL